MIGRKQTTQAVSDYLTHHRHDPPERDGWFTPYEIASGVKSELDLTLYSGPIYTALRHLMEAEPPQVEDSWLTRDNYGTLDLENRYEHPNQPADALRFYRAIGASIEYIQPS